MKKVTTAIVDNICDWCYDPCMTFVYKATCGTFTIVDDKTYTSKEELQFCSATCRDIYLYYP